MSDKLVLHIEIPDFNVDGLRASADEFCDGDVALIVTEELMRKEVGLMFVTLPGEKEQNSDFEVHTRVGRIVGAQVVP